MGGKKEKLPVLHGVIVVLLLLTGACARDVDERRVADVSGKSGKLTLAEAKMTFEHYFSSYARTRSGAGKRNILVSFDYTLLWDQGDVNHSGYGSTATVPIRAGRELFVVHLDADTKKPAKAARVRQEVQVVKNFERGAAYPIIRTVVPLDGCPPHSAANASQAGDHAATRNEFVLYQALDGKKIAMQLFENGIETVHAFIGEDPESYSGKLRKILSALKGYAYIESRAHAADTRAEPRYCTDCGMPYEGLYHDCIITIWGCAWCGGTVDLNGDGHIKTPCLTCEEEYCPGEEIAHFCEYNYCSTCEDYFWGPVWKHTCIQNYCVPCSSYYYGSNHICESGICGTCYGTYLGSYYNHRCPGPFCPVCHTAPCQSGPCPAPNCGVTHCPGHNPPSSPGVPVKQDLKTIADKLPPSPLKNMLMKAFNNPNFKFIENNTIDSWQIRYNTASNTGQVHAIASIQYNKAFYDNTSAMGHELAILHEICHPVLRDAGVTSADHHHTMMTDPAYDAAIRALYPGYTSQEYQYMKYAYAGDQTVGMSPADEQAMKRFLAKYGIIDPNGK